MVEIVNAGNLERLGEPYRTVLGELLRALHRTFGDNLVSVAVFGSVARGTARRDSDIDLLLVADGLPRSIRERVRMYLGAEEAIDPLLDRLLDEGYAITINPIIKSREEAARTSPLYLDMTEDAVILYDRDGFLTSLLARLRQRLRELGAERVWVGRRWYWRLKRDYVFGEVVEL